MQGICKLYIIVSPPHQTCVWVPTQQLSHVQLFAMLWTMTHHAALSMEFSSQEYWSGLPFPPPGDPPNPGIEPLFLALQVDSLPLSHQGSPHVRHSSFWSVLVTPIVSNTVVPKNCSKVKKKKKLHIFPLSCLSLYQTTSFLGLCHRMLY